MRNLLSRLAIAAALALSIAPALAQSYQQTVPDIATMEGFGVSSPIVGTVIILNAGGTYPNSSAFNWQPSSCTIDGTNTFAATGVSPSLGCWKRAAAMVPASTTAGAGLIVPEGVDPTGTITNGSIWLVSGQGLKYELDGSTKTLGIGTVSVTGSPAANELTSFSSSTGITNGNLSGDCTTANTLAILCTQTNGVAFAASATTDATNASNIATGTLSIARLASDVGLTDHNQTWHAQAGASETLSLSGNQIIPDFNGYSTHGVTLVHGTCPCVLEPPIGTLTPGKAGFFRFTQSSSGGDVVTLGSGYIWGGGSGAFALSGVASHADGFSYQIDDLGAVWISQGDYNAF